MKRLKTAFLGGVLAVLSFHAFAEGQTFELTPEEQAKIDQFDQETAQLQTKSDIRGLVADIRKVDGLTLGTKSTVLGINKTITDLKGEIRGTKIYFQFSSDVLFDFDKADIKPTAVPDLEKLASVIKEKAKGGVEINGYTDAKGSDSYNKKLSLKRAKSVKNWLEKEGKAKASYKVKGFGEASPIAPNTNKDGSDNPEGRAKNRRVEIIVQSKK